MSRYTIHLSLDIEGALRWPRRKLAGLLINADTGRKMTADEVASVLCAELRAGKVALPMGCPSPNADGTCPTHPI